MGSSLPDEPDDVQDDAGLLDEAKAAEAKADEAPAPDPNAKGPEFFRNPEGGPLITEDPGPQDADAPAEG